MTAQEIRKAIQKAKTDKSVYNDLIRFQQKKAKTANQRLRQLKKSGLNTAAERIALNYLNSQGRKNFSRSKRLSLEALERELLETSDFLRYQTSTVRGERLRRKRILDSLRKNSNIEVKDENRFFDLMESDAFQFFKGFAGQSGGRIREALDKLDEGGTIADMERIYQYYLEHENEMDEFEAWEEWMNTDSENPFNPDEWERNN